jgi:hypothetical protein
VVSTIMVIVSLEETRPRRRGGNGQAGRQPYEPVPAADDAAVGERIGGAGAEGRREVELGGVKHTDGGRQIGDSSADSEAAAADSSRDHRIFRDDSARPSPPDAVSLQQQGRGAKQQRGAQQGPATDGVRGSRSDADSDDITVYWPEDLERGGLLPAAHPAGAAAPAAGVLEAGAKPAGPGAAAAAAAALPWHKQRKVMTALLGYGLIAFFFNILVSVHAVLS